MNNPRRIQRHLVKALAAGAVLVAAALPLAISGVASAATAPTLTAIAFTPHGATPNATGADVASGTATFTGSGFANNGATNNTLVATCSAGTLVFSSVAETSATTGTASFVTTGTAAATCNVVLTDGNGVATSVTDAANLDAIPTISLISPNKVWEATAPTTVTITGTGFVTGATVAITNNVDGTALTSSVTSVSATSIVLSVTPTNPSGGAAATPGAFGVVVSNTDGGTSTAGAFTVGNGLENVTPSAESAIGSYTVALLGSGFQYGATVSLSTYSTPGVAGGTYTADGGACLADITNATVSGISNALATTITSPTAGTITVPITAVTAADCALTLTNTGAGNNAIGYQLLTAFGVGQANAVAPVITSSNSTTPITVGSPATTVTLTGSGFSSYSTVGAAPATGVAYTAANGAAGSTLTFNATVSSGVFAGAVPVTVSNGAGSTTFTPAITVAGPAITSQAPNLVVGAPIGATVVLTGTGFSNTTTGTASGAGMTGTVSYASATTLNLVVTGSPTGTTGGVVNVSTVTGTGTVNAATFSLTIDAPPLVVSAVTYATGAGSDVGVGATAATVYIHGSGFSPGATVTAFVNGAGVADPNVTATVTAITPTQITATVAIKGPDANTAVGYTVTNTDGGAVKVAAFAYPIFIGQGPTITAVSPTPVLASATNAVTITGTGFQAGAVVSPTSNGTCGAATVVSATSITASCTFGVAQTVAVSLVVTNTDGGSATSAVVLPAVTSTKPATFHVTGAHGYAVPGKTSTMTISGTGFYGQPRITSSAAGTRVTVSKDTGHLLTIRVTTKAGTKHRTYTFTIRLANGKTGRANYSVK